jgi:5-methylthioadenosine/S-adenosylhomocysteine deaminase
MDTRPADTIIKNGYVVTMDPDRTILSDGAVAIVGTRIAAVGPSSEIVAGWHAPQIIDARGSIVLPGLIDGHNHPNQYLSKGIGDDVEIFTWLRNIFAYEAHLSPEEAYIGALGNFVEMVRSGTTCFNEPGSYHTDAIGRAAEQVGIRGILSRSTMDLLDPSIPFPPNLVEDFATIVERAEATVERWNGAAHGRLRAWYSLRHAISVSDELALAIKQRADRDGVGIHCHAAVGDYENVSAIERFGKRSLQRLHDLGLFAPNLYLVHMGAASDDEIDLLAHFDVKVSHCPSASMFGSYGVIQNRKIPLMIERGIKVSLGSDSATAGRFLDLVRCMYLAACAHRDAYASPDVMGAYKSIEMATIDGACACLWHDEIGALVAGMEADITIIDTADIDWKPCRDPIRSLVYTANGTSVDTVIVAGRVLMRHRQMTMIDERWLRRELEQVGTNVMKRAGITTTIPWPVN